MSTTGGCLANAFAAVPGVFAAYNALREPYEQLQESIAVDPRVVTAEQRWSTCMSDHGHRYDRPADVRAGLDDVGAAATSGGSADAAYPTGEPPMDKQRATLETGSLCDSRVGLAAAVTDAAIDHEASFVRQYRAVLESFKHGSGPKSPDTG